MLDFSETLRIIIHALNIEDLCNGSTPDSDSVCGGSNPSSSAKDHPKGWSFFIRRGWGIRKGDLGAAKGTKCPVDTWLARGRIHERRSRS